MKEQSGTSLTQTLTERLASRRLLLLLDNAEHVLGACAQLADALLRGCQQIVIVVTSRERLGIAGELTYRVPSLSVPDPSRDMTYEQVTAHESAQLFIERARLQRPHFAITVANASALASICHRLDGIPLAIELAAPRVRSMSVEELSNRLDQRFGLLTGGSRTAMPRHRTLRSLIDWSYDLLSDAEKVVLNRLSVFAGGCTLEAAAQVCFGDGVAAGEVLELLTSLVDKSLLVTEERDGRTRYGLLETVRHYGRDQLRESGEEMLAHRRHRKHFLAVAEESEPAIKTAEQQMWLDRLEIEHDNMRSALARSSETGGDSVEGLRIAGALFPFWLKRGYFGEGRKWLSELLAAAPTGPAAAPAHGKALNGAGILACWQGDHPAARRRLEESLAIGRRTGDRHRIAVALHGLGMVDTMVGAYATGRASIEESLVIYRELDDRWNIANVLIQLGNIARDQSDAQGAQSLYQEGLALYRTMGEPLGIANAIRNLGDLAQDRADYAGARALYVEALAIERQLGDPRSIAFSLGGLGQIACTQGDFAAAEALYKEALMVQRELADRPGIVFSLEGLAATSATATPRRAARLWARATQLREETGSARPPIDKPAHDRQIDVARAALGDNAAFEAAWQEGSAMTLERAVQYALDAEEPS